jgi:hypothetical protein
MKQHLKYSILIPFFLLLISNPFVHGQEVENEFQSRTSIQIKYSPTKKIKLHLSPELRFADSWILLKYHMETGASYKLYKIIEIEAAYRFVINPRMEKETDYYSRFFYGISARKKINRFAASFRLSYSNYADDDAEKSNYLRYKTLLRYNIPKSKITPVVAAEAFHKLSDNEFYKMRYTVGAEYKLFKKNYIGIRYKLDFFRAEYRNRHIISLDYKFKF